MAKDITQELVQRHEKAVALFEEGSHKQAMAMARELVAAARSQLGQRHPFLEACLSTLGTMHETLSEPHEAEPLYAEALEIRRFTAGKSDPSLFQSLSRLARVRLELGDSTSAESLTRESIEICERALGADSEAMIHPLNIHAQVNLATGKVREAIDTLNRAMTVSNDTGDNDLKIARVQTMMLTGDAYGMLHAHDDAYESYSSALAEARELFGAGHPRVVQCLEKLAEFCQNQGDFRQSDACRLEVARTVREVVGERSSEFAERLAGLATVRHLSGRREEGDRLFAAAESVLGRAGERRTPGHAMLLVARGNSAAQHGDWRSALDHFGRAMEILSPLGEGAEGVAVEVMERLAAVQLAAGDSQAAASTQSDALAIRNRLAGPLDGPRAEGRAEPLAGTLEALASIAYRRRDFDSAEALARQALKVCLAAPSLGEESYKGIHVKSLLGAVLLQRGKRDEGVRLLREAESKMRELVGDEHSDHAGILRPLAGELAITGREGDAIAVLQQNLRLTLAELRCRARAAPSVTWTIELDVLKDTLAEIIALSAVPALTGAGDGAERQRFAEAALNQLLRVKPATLDLLAGRDTERLARLHPMQSRLARNLHLASARLLAHLDAEPHPQAVEAYKRRVVELTRELEEAEEHLEAEAPEFAQWRRVRAADVASIAAVLPPGSVLLELAHYHPINFKAAEQDTRRLWLPPRYACFILHAGRPDAVRAIDLGDAQDIDRLVSALATGLAAGNSTAAAELGSRLLGPVFPEIVESTRLFVAPDGQLSRVPLDLLTDDAGRLLADRFEITLLSSGSDLLRASRGPAAEPVVMSEPDFDQTPATPPVPDRAAQVKEPGTLTRLWSRWTAKLRRAAAEPAPPTDLVQLDAPADIPASPAVSADLSAAARRLERSASLERRSEAEAVAKLASARLLLGAECSAASAMALTSPRYLHIAAPYFALADAEHDPNNWLDLGVTLVSRPRGPAAGPEVESPLLRCGLFLAGANAALEGRAHGAGAGYGVFTGRDITAMDLTYTELAVLSNRSAFPPVGEACGRDMLALVRSFLAAGARSLVLSLWPIRAEAAGLFADKLYERLSQGAPSLEAYRHARLALRQARPQDASWASFVYYGPTR
jgi:tetratricopeptide (TPR) repeat protein